MTKYEALEKNAVFNRKMRLLTNLRYGQSQVNGSVFGAFPVLKARAFYQTTGALAEGEELGSNLLQVLHRRPAELGGLGKVAGAAPALPPGPKAAKRLFCPGATLSSQNPGWL